MSTKKFILITLLFYKSTKLSFFVTVQHKIGTTKYGLATNGPNYRRIGQFKNTSVSELKQLFAI